jgi:hypothetical protein
MRGNKCEKIELRETEVRAILQLLLLAPHVNIRWQMCNIRNFGMRSGTGIFGSDLDSGGWNGWRLGRDKQSALDAEGDIGACEEITKTAPN